MGLLYKDRAGNRLYINSKNIFAKNRRGKLINKSGVLAMLVKADKAGKIKYKR